MRRRRFSLFVYHFFIVGIKNWFDGMRRGIIRSYLLDLEKNDDNNHWKFLKICSSKKLSENYLAV